MILYLDIFHPNERAFRLLLNLDNNRHVSFENPDLKEQECIDYLLDKLVPINGYYIYNENFVYAILGIAYSLGIYDNAKAILNMKGLGSICNECDTYLPQ